MEEQETIGIAPMRKEMGDSLWECFRLICEEDNCLGFLHAPPREELQDYVEKMVESKYPMMVAFMPGMKIIGCCDIKMKKISSFRNCGTLGIFVHPDYRNLGIATVLMERALRMAFLHGFERIELEAFQSNAAALHLYEKFGFEFQGVAKRGRNIAGGYSDVVQMARWLDRKKKSL